jgi:PAS domain S-box-containing protein
MAEYENVLRYQVGRVVGDIKYEQSLTEQRLKKYIQERTNEACQIAKNLFDQYAGVYDDITLRKLIKDSLRNIRFNDGRGYYFAINVNGTEELFPPHPELEGQDLRPQKNDQGQFVVADMLEIARSAGEGFYQYTWSKPNTPGVNSPKIAFIKYLPELDWVIGTGEYLDDFTAEIQEELCTRIEQIRFGKDKKEYVFVATWDGIAKTFPAKGKNMLETKDANGLYIVKELIKKAKEGGGFVQYIMPMLDGVQSKAKLSYAAPIPEWQWYVGSGVYIDEIDTTIAENRQIFKDKVVNHLTIVVLVLICLLIIHFCFSHFISRNVWQQIDIFSKFLKNAIAEPVSMQSNILAYKEFREISGLINGMLGERNAILETIRLSRDEWVNTFDAIGDCIMLLDDKGTIVRANKTAGNIHGVAAKNLIGMPFGDLCCPDNPVNATLLDKLPHTGEIKNEKLKRSFLASSFPIVSTEGRLERIIHIAHDITERKKLEQQLTQSQKLEAIGTLAGGIAHDFNNILAAILGYTELAHRASSPESLVAQYLDQVIRAGTRAKGLVKQILTFSRQGKNERLALQPSSIIKETLKLLRSSIPTTITIRQDIDENSAMILADPTQLHQIIMNICTNAYQAMEDTGGVLSLSLQEKFLTRDDVNNHPDVQPGVYIELSFKDNGPGMLPEIQERIFEPFFTTKDTSKGTGMGLAIVHGIVKSYGGFITCNSRLDEGTVFTVYLPTLAEKGVCESKAQKMSGGGSERILFVDDEKMLADIGQIILEELGYSVTVCTKSLDALAVFQKQPDAFDLVITDQTMPELTGNDLVRRLLQIRPDIPIILCTGYSSQISGEKATSLGIKGFAMKPLAKNDLAALIRKVLDGGDLVS